jgi:negative regulator of flagellin synthesis FlgM
MDISTKNQAVSLERYINQVQLKQRVEPADEKPAGQQGIKTDTVHLSETAKLVHDAQKQIREIPDVRQDKVSEIKRMIADGTYQVKPDAVADKMIHESLLNDLFE